jgi:5-methylcytosine-specific restriction protein A
VPSGRKYCDEHSRLHPEETRSASARGYGRRWQKASKAYLRAHPLCAECERAGRYVKATVVDHKVPHRGDPALFWDQSNWQPLCKPCHDKKTGSEDSRPTYRY